MMHTETSEALYGVTAYVEVRSQHSCGSSAHTFGGPDTYVAVQVVPDGEKPLKCLNSNVAKLRDIKIVYFGEGYSKNRATRRSALGSALIKARKYADRINNANRHAAG